MSGSPTRRAMASASSDRLRRRRQSPSQVSSAANVREKPGAGGAVARPDRADRGFEHGDPRRVDPTRPHSPSLGCSRAQPARAGPARRSRARARPRGAASCGGSGSPAWRCGLAERDRELDGDACVDVRQELDDPQRLAEPPARVACGELGRAPERPRSACIPGRGGRARPDPRGADGPRSRPRSRSRPRLVSSTRAMRRCRSRRRVALTSPANVYCTSACANS